jgi:AraC-type DNA-binding domain-containing proteins
MPLINNKPITILPLRELKEIYPQLPSRQRYENECFFVTSGYVIRKYNFNPVRINKNDFHLTLSGGITGIQEYSDAPEGYYCAFENDFLDRVYLKNTLGKELAFINSFMSRYPLRTTAETAGRIEHNFREMAGLIDEYQPDYCLIHAYLAACIYEIKRIMIRSHLNPYPMKAFLITKQYYDLLAHFIKEEQSVEFYAGTLNVTSNHLNKSVKSVTGKTAIGLLNEMRLLEAKMQLRQTGKTIGEIAFNLGFEDQSYFTRFFKKHTGCSPLTYRKLDNHQND